MTTRRKEKRGGPARNELKNRETPAPVLPSGLTVGDRIESANRWREAYNPLRGLTIERAVSLLEAYQRGEYADIMWALYFVEQTDPDLLAIIERRTSALLQLDWNIKIVAEEKRRSDFDEKLANDQAQALRNAYERLTNLYDLIEHLSLGSFRGYAIAQKQFISPSGAKTLSPVQPNLMELLDPWRIIRDGMYGAYYWNPNAQTTTAIALGEKHRLDPARDGLIIREVRRPIGRIALLKFIRSSLSEKDWDGFVEIYGIPASIIIGPPNIPTGKESQYQAAAEDVAEGSSGYLPNGSTVHSPDGIRGMAPFKARLDHLSEKLVLAGTGGLLTMLTQSGSGTLAGGAHQETFEIIARAEARKISEVMQRQFDRIELATQFPGKPVLAYFELAADEEQDIGKVIEHATALHSMGVGVDLEELKENTGYNLYLLPPSPQGGPHAPAQPQPGAPDPGTSGRQAFFNRDGGPDLDKAAALVAEAADVATNGLGKALAEDLAPLADRLQAVLAADTDDGFREALKKLQADLPGLLAQKPGRVADELANLMAAAFANGIEAASGAAKP
jgi:phage gp29-like protein